MIIVAGDVESGALVVLWILPIHVEQWMALENFLHLNQAVSLNRNPQFRFWVHVVIAWKEEWHRSQSLTINLIVAQNLHGNNTFPFLFWRMGTPYEVTDLGNLLLAFSEDYPRDTATVKPPSTEDYCVVGQNFDRSNYRSLMHRVRRGEIYNNRLIRDGEWSRIENPFDVTIHSTESPKAFRVVVYRRIVVVIGFGKTKSA